MSEHNDQPGTTDRRRARRGRSHRCDGRVVYPRLMVMCQCDRNAPPPEWAPPPPPLEGRW